MNYEEKYKSALGWMQSLYGGLHGVTKEEAEKYFPELKESEDERIKRELRNDLILYVPTPERYIAWLEKQEEPKDKGEISDGYHTFNELYRYRLLYNAAFFNLLPKELVHKSKRHHDGEECFGGGWFIVMANLPTGQISNHYELKDWDLFQIPEKDVADKWDGHTPQEAADRLHKYLLEKHGEQPTDKVEPKFKVGDWIVKKDGEPFAKGNNYAQITNIDKEQYWFDSGTWLIAEDIRLWTIADAKCGDVLASELGDSIFLFRGIKDNKIDFYCDYDTYDAGLECPYYRFGINDADQHYGSVEKSKDIHPATKEQRDLLFAKMKEAGYEFDSEKKELKKIKTKTLNPDKVIEWLKTNVFDDSAYGKAMNDKFKEDIGL